VWSNGGTYEFAVTAQGGKPPSNGSVREAGGYEARVWLAAHVIDVQADRHMVQLVQAYDSVLARETGELLEVAAVCMNGLRAALLVAREVIEEWLEIHLR